MAEPKTKMWWESSTVWINLVGALVVALKLVVDSNLIPDADVTAIVVALLNILNRFRAPKVVLPIEKKLV